MDITLCSADGLKAEVTCGSTPNQIDIFVDEASTTPVDLKIVVHKPEGDKEEIELPVGHRIF